MIGIKYEAGFTHDLMTPFNNCKTMRALLLWRMIYLFLFFSFSSTFVDLQDRVEGQLLKGQGGQATDGADCHSGTFC
jgi:hypothetical protein